MNRKTNRAADLGAGSERIAAGLEEALAYVRGEKTGVKVHTAENMRERLKAVRRTLGLTQDEMAALLGTSLSGYRKWEQGQRSMHGPARTLVILAEKEPDAFLRALRAA